LRNDGGGDLNVIILFLHYFWAILGVLGGVRKLESTPFTGMFYFVNVASIRLTIPIQVRAFEK
jgi:hypothetical protein